MGVTGGSSEGYVPFWEQAACVESRDCQRAERGIAVIRQLMQLSLCWRVGEAQVNGKMVSTLHDTFSGQGRGLRPAVLSGTTFVFLIPLLSSRVVPSRFVLVPTNLDWTRILGVETRRHCARDLNSHLGNWSRLPLPSENRLFQ
jgi:hypothetical protein